MNILTSNTPCLLVAVLLVTWFTISVAAQAKLRQPKWVRGLEYVGLVPRWTFFAPRPCMSDYHILVRDKLLDGSITSWLEVPIVDDFRLSRMFWNPGKRQRKAFIDLVANLKAECRHLKREQMVQVSVPYLAFLNFVTFLPRSYVPSATQFLLLETMCNLRSQKMTTIAVSAFHEVSL